MTLSPLGSGAVRAAAMAVTLWLAAQAGHTMWLCGPHQAWQRVQAGESTVVLEQGVRVARPGDAIFVCETPHRTGPIVWHLDLECYCAPAAMTAERVGRTVGGSCRIDQLNPQPSDNAGACRSARCGQHLESDVNDN